MRIRNAGNKRVTARISDIMGALETLQEPEARPGQHEYLRAVLKRNVCELAALTSQRS
jgi:hypothetical protein